MSPAGAARLLVRCARRTLARRHRFTVALNGVARAGHFVHALAHEPEWATLDARRLHLFVLDSDWPAPWPALGALPVPVDHLHRPRATLSRADAAQHFERLLHAHFSLRPGDVPVFDLVVLDRAGLAASDDGAQQLSRLVVPARDGRAVALSAAVVGAAARVVTLGPSRRDHPSTARSSGIDTPATSRDTSSGLPPS